MQKIKDNIKQKGLFSRNHVEAILAYIRKYNPDYNENQIREEVKKVLQEFANTNAKERAIDIILGTLEQFRNYPKG